jgi:hypothetical protein
MTKLSFPPSIERGIQAIWAMLDWTSSPIDAVLPIWQRNQWSRSRTALALAIHTSQPVYRDDVPVRRAGNDRVAGPGVDLEVKGTSPKVTFIRVLQRIRYLLRRPGCFRPSDRWAGWDSRPRAIADFHGVLSWGTGPSYALKAAIVYTADVELAVQSIASTRFEPGVPLSSQNLAAAGLFVSCWRGFAANKKFGAFVKPL